MRFVRLAAMLALLGGTLILLLQGFDTAQDTKPAAVGKTAPATALDVSYITDDFFAAIVVQPARLLKAPGMKDSPLEPVIASLKEQFGVDAKQIEQVMLLVPRIDRGWLDIGGVIRLGQPVANRTFLERATKGLGWGELNSVERAGRTYWRSTKRIGFTFYLPDERTIVFGSERLLGSMVFNLAPGGKLAGLLRKADASADVLAVIDTGPPRELLAGERLALERRRGAFGSGPEELIVSVALQLLRRIESFQFTADFSQGSRLRWEIAATSEADAELLHDLVRGWQAALKLALPAIMEQMDAEDAGGFQAEVQKLGSRLATDVVGGITTNRKEDRVIVQLETKSNYLEFLASAPKLMASARDEGVIAVSANNLHQLALGVHIYHDTYNALPAHAIYEADKDGKVKKDAKPLLSWRVSLLPFLERNDLYQSFHLDEPWDSPHNKKLIASMPSVFKSPNVELGEGKTCYMLPMISEGQYATMFPKQAGVRAGQGATTFGSVTDGLSHTIMIVEAAPEKAVIWTKPDDWEVDLKKPKEGLFGARRGFALAARGEASAIRISEKVSGETLLKALGRPDSEIYDHDELRVLMSTVMRPPASPDSPRHGEQPAQDYWFGETKTMGAPRGKAFVPRKTDDSPFPRTKVEKSPPRD